MLMINISIVTAKINEDNFGPEDDDIQFDDCGYGDDDDVDEVSSFYPSFFIIHLYFELLLFLLF